MCNGTIRLLTIVFVVLFSLLSKAQALGTPVYIELPSAGQDIELDVSRNQAYVSIPTMSEIVVVSLSSFQITDAFFIGQAPHGIDLSSDDSTLYAALNASGAVASFGIDNQSLSTIDISADLDDPRTWDVVEGKPNRVYASSNPGSSGFAYIVQIKTDEGNSSSRVASNRIIRCQPTFEDSPDDEFLYVGECFSPNSLYKLDLGVDTAPIIGEDQHGSVSGTNHLDVNPAGTRLLLRSGQVLRTGTLTQDGLITPGPSQVSEDGSKYYVAVSPNTIAVHDAATYSQIDTITLPCNFSSPDTLRVLPGETGFLVLDGDILCGVTDVAPVSLTISPPSGKYLNTQNIDITVIIGFGESTISNFSLLYNGIDVTGLFGVCAVTGFTTSSALTLRCPGLNLQAGTHNIEVTVEFAGGGALNESASWEVLPTIEFPNPGM